MSKGREAGTSLTTGFLSAGTRRPLTQDSVLGNNRKSEPRAQNNKILLVRPQHHLYTKSGSVSKAGKASGGSSSKKQSTGVYKAVNKVKDLILGAPPHVKEHYIRPYVDINQKYGVDLQNSVDLSTFMHDDYSLDQIVYGKPPVKQHRKGASRSSKSRIDNRLNKARYM